MWWKNKAILALITQPCFQICFFVFNLAILCYFVLGSGASCIYPLLGAKLNNWHFLATEVDDLSVSYAVDNVKSNGLENNIKGKKAFMRICRFFWLVLNTIHDTLINWRVKN